MSKSDEFVRHLADIAEKGDEDRAPLAELRRGASGEARDLARVYRIVLPHVRGGIREQDAYVAVACLFGLHPTKLSQLGASVSLAEAMRQLKAKSESRSIEDRFIALLQSHPEELLEHLRHCVSLARSHQPPISLKWTDILKAVLYWGRDSDTPGRTSQERLWAQQFWAPTQEPPTPQQQPEA
jgi:CRISPR system Cascade subunit CasB